MANKYMNKCSSLTIKDILPQSEWHSSPKQQMLVRMQRKKGTLIYCLWECKLVQPLWKSVLRFLKKVKIDLGHCHITLGHISEGVSINIQ
jgi:hypothetical protein